jgi:hypothetical protein
MLTYERSSQLIQGILSGYYTGLEKMITLRPSPRSTLGVKERLFDGTIQTHTGGRDVVGGRVFSTIRLSPLIQRGKEGSGICRGCDIRVLAWFVDTSP